MRYDLLLLILGLVSIMAGMAARNFLKYAPIIGWLLGVVLILVAAALAFQVIR